MALEKIDRYCMDPEKLRELIRNQGWVIIQPLHKTELTRSQRRALIKQAAEIRNNPDLAEVPELEQQLREIEDQLDQTINETIPWTVQRPRISRSCDDCGRSVINRTVSSRIYQRPQLHWRHCCAGCRQFKNPDTGEFSIPIRYADRFFSERLNQRDK